MLAVADFVFLLCKTPPGLIVVLRAHDALAQREESLMFLHDVLPQQIQKPPAWIQDVICGRRARVIAIQGLRDLSRQRTPPLMFLQDLRHEPVVQRDASPVHAGEQTPLLLAVVTAVDESAAEGD